MQWSDFDKGLGRMDKTKSSLLLEDLYKQKMVKLTEQKELSDKMNRILAKMNNSSSECRRNLLAAIAVSNQSGYHDYYETPKELKEIEDQKVLNTIARAIQKVHREVVQINEEIQQCEASQPKARVEDVPLSSLNQWFEVYGRPKEDGVMLVKDMLSTFRPNGKVSCVQRVFN